MTNKVILIAEKCVLNDWSARFCRYHIVCLIRFCQDHRHNSGSVKVLQITQDSAGSTKVITSDRDKHHGDGDVHHRDRETA